MDLEHARTLVNSHLDELSPELRKINSAIHANPEIGFEEFFAHDTLASYLENRGFQVKRQAYGVETSFEATLGTGGRQVVYCAEYDALPGIGHACGHNLIATSSLAAFLGAAHAMSTLKIAGRLRLLGTPAEEGGGGKIKLIEAGAFSPTTDVAAAIMAHPTASHQFDDLGMGVSGLAGLKLISSYKFKIEFRGQTAHAASEPWHGRNALDAAVAAYANVGLLRQQIRPDERIHAVIEDGGTVPNVITEYTRMNWNVRSPTVAACEKLVARVKACLDAAASATGCEISYTMAPTYMNMRENRSLCQTYVEDMAKIGEKIALTQPTPFNASTDMGNVSHIVPSFHGAFAVTSTADVVAHNPGFAAAAGTDEAHGAAMSCAKGMAMLGLRVLTDDAIASGAWEDCRKTDDPV